MLRLSVAAIILIASAGQSVAAPCYYTDGSQHLYLLPMSGDVAVTRGREGLPPFACSTSSAGTGIAGRMVHCDSLGFSSPMRYEDDGTITFRDATWKPVECPDEDDVLDLMGN